MTPADIIATARYTLNDTDSTGYRQSDAELLDALNDCFREAVILRPELFSTIGDYTCTVGQCEQTITFTDAAALLEVLCIHGGAALTPFDLAAMSAFNPNWRADTAGAAAQWSRFDNDPLKFYVYPKAPATAQILDVRYVRNPTTYALNDLITDLPITYKPALVQGVIGKAESKDSEHVLSQRAQAAQATFVALIKG